MTIFSTGTYQTALRIAALSGLLWLCAIQVSASSEVEMSGFIIVQETDSGRWEIQADRAIYTDETDVLLNGVSAKMISGGEDQVSVISKSGRFESDRLVLHLEGDVVIASHWGSSLRAPVVQWDGEGDYLEASGGVTLQRGLIMVTGSSARYTIETGTARVTGGVRMVLEKEKKSP